MCYHCGVGADKISPRLIELLEQLRKNIGGVRNSQHVLGTAADVAIPEGMSFELCKWHVLQLPFDGIGLYPDSDFIHVDVRNGGVGSKMIW